VQTALSGRADAVSPLAAAAQVQPTSTFQAELGLDSLDTVEVVMAFEEEFSIEIPDSEADKILSVADAIEYVAAHPQAK
jgi:NADH dehydrogenase (ubiquinone) 1 alpha/beta subcomplex 1